MNAQLRLSVSFLTTVLMTAPLLSCGSSSQPTQSPPPVSQPGTVASWSRVMEQTACEAMEPARCVGAYGFSVTSEGRFQAGPSPEGEAQTGNVSADELSLLQAAANRAAPLDPNLALTKGLKRLETMNQDNRSHKTSRLSSEPRHMSISVLLLGLLPDHDARGE